MFVSLTGDYFIIIIFFLVYSSFTWYHGDFLWPWSVLFDLHQNMLHPPFPLSFALWVWSSLDSRIFLFVSSATDCEVLSKDSGIRFGSAHHCSSFAYSELLCSPPFLTLVSYEPTEYLLLSAWSPNYSPSGWSLYFFKFLFNLDSKFCSKENSRSFLSFRYYSD